MNKKIFMSKYTSSNILKILLKLSTCSSRTVVAAIIILSATQFATAQSGIESPYSRYGVGLLSDRSMGFNKAMAGVAQGFRDGQEINMANPASYSAVDSLTALFDLGMTVSYNNYKLGNLQQHVRNASFDYGAFHFRATKGLGIAVAVVPFSKINYSFSGNPTPVDGTSAFYSSSSYTGKGGLRQAVLGIGWNVYKPLSIGVNAGVLWGDYSHTVATTTTGVSSFPVTKVYSADLITYTLDFGIQYVQKINKNDDITIGGTYTLGHNINKPAYLNITTIGTTDIPETEYKIDDAISLPHSFAVGVTYRHGRQIRVGADYEMQLWSKTRFPQSEEYELATDPVTKEFFTHSTGNLYDRHRAAVGLEYTPDVYARQYIKRISYKLGGYYSTSYAKTDGSELTSKPYEFGLTAGVTLPLANRNLFRSTPKINLSVSWTRTNIPYRSNTSTASNIVLNKLTEDYLRFSVGLTISERWFYKWKVQ